MTDWDKLIQPAELKTAIRERKKTYLEKTAWKSALEDEATEGWYFFRDTKNPAKVKVHKDKSIHAVFENRLWVLFAMMGFNYLNRDNTFTINYSTKGENLSKQIDVFAADDETVLVVECKCAESTNDKKQWKTELEAIKGYMGPVRSEILNRFPNHNVKYIFATKNYVLGEQDKNRLNEFGIAHFDEKTISYYEELVKHLGTTARYQLLGALFANKKIAGMDNRIPAIRGKMGGYTYYAFSIQPETLLKIGYVLHRSEANEGLMPTYQRIIKKSRLKSVREFIENKGFFPNSIVISIDAKKEPMFDLAEKQGNDDVAKLGILHLPNEYRSAYIIDGQHRLYGYSDSKYAKTNSIPVVAFWNMEQKEQVKLFMEINENQKAVSKNLRNTLNADLLWVSDNPSEQREALRSRIAQDLGDDTKSPLFNRVIIGEDQADDYRCITLEMICNAIENTNLLSKFAKDGTPLIHGIFDMGENEKTWPLLEKYLFACISYLKTLLPEEWELNPKKDGMLLFNNAIGGVIRLLGDIADELSTKGYSPKKMDEFINNAHQYLDPIENFIKNLTEEEKIELRTNYGGSGPRHYWRNLQKAVHDAYDDFLPAGYDHYWEEHGKAYNNESIELMAKIEESVRVYIKEVLISAKGNDGWKSEVPLKVLTDALKEATKAEIETGQVTDIWEFFDMKDLQEIVVYKKNWSKYFEAFFVLPSTPKGNKQTKSNWMLEIAKLKKTIGKATFSVSKSQYEMLKEVAAIVLPNLG